MYIKINNKCINLDNCIDFEIIEFQGSISFIYTNVRGQNKREAINCKKPKHIQLIIPHLYEALDIAMNGDEETLPVKMFHLEAELEAVLEIFD